MSGPDTAQGSLDMETEQPLHFVDDEFEDFEPSGNMRAKTAFELAVEKNARNGNAYEMVESSKQFQVSELPSGAGGEVNPAFTK